MTIKFQQLGLLSPELKKNKKLVKIAEYVMKENSYKHIQK